MSIEQKEIDCNTAVAINSFPQMRTISKFLLDSIAYSILKVKHFSYFSALFY